MSKPKGQWGGPRPKVRADDPRGGARPGAGRPATRFILRQNKRQPETYALDFQPADPKGITQGAAWTILEMDADSVTLGNDAGDRLTLRKT